MAEKFNREKEKNEKLKELKARLNFEGCSETLQYSESRTMSTKEHEKRHISRRSRSPRSSVFSRIRRERSRSPRQKLKEGGIYTESLSESDDSRGGHEVVMKEEKSCGGDDLSQHGYVEEVDLFTLEIRYFDFPKKQDSDQPHQAYMSDYGEVAASNHERKKAFPPWKQLWGGVFKGQNFKKGGFWNQQRSERKQDRFTLFTKTPKEFFALDKGKFKAPPPMTTPVEKRNHAKFCEFHGKVGHNTDEYMHLRKQIEEMLQSSKAVALGQSAQTRTTEMEQLK
ncbi:hypothetical protein Tco_0619276 [Tanacetum coccineum]